MKKNFSEIFSFVKKFYEKFDQKIPLHEPVFFGNEKKYVNDAIESTFVSSVGKYVDLFEKKISEYNNIKKSVSVVNGTSALQVCLRLCGVRSGDEVLTQSLTFVATSNAISYLNAKPVFIDVDIDTMGLSPDALKNFLSEFGEKRDDGTYNKFSGKKIAACMPMHTFGFIGKIDQIIKICDKWNIPVIEDSAEALGSKYKGKSSGSFGKMSAFSFNGNKVLTTGGGGMIVTNNEQLGKQAKHITTTAKLPHKWEYDHDMIGYNFRMPNINAAIGCAQLENLDKIIHNKSLLYLEFKTLFDKIGVELVTPPKDCDWNYWLSCIKLSDRKDRDLFLRLSHDEGVLNRPIWKLHFRLKMYSNCQRDSQKNSIFLEDRIVNVTSSAKF